MIDVFFFFLFLDPRTSNLFLSCLDPVFICTSNLFFLEIMLKYLWKMQSFKGCQP